MTGERAHYEIAAGHVDRAAELAHAMQAFAGANQLLPEQVWDAADIPELELFAGGATGSARPLVWAHSEYVKLRRSIHDGDVFDRPPQTVARYVNAVPPVSRFAVWRFNNKRRTMPAGMVLRIETLAPAIVHVGIDGWSRVLDLTSIDTSFGVWIADVDSRALGVTRSVDFTFYWPDVDRWEGADFQVRLAT